MGLSGKVLIVDDEEQIRLIVRHFLKNAGLTVVEAADGAIALELLRSEPFDYVITDLMMPNLTGDMLIREARRLPGCERTRFIVLTGSTLQSPASEARDMRELQADGYIRKPFEVATLLSVVSSVSRS